MKIKKLAIPLTVVLLIGLIVAAQRVVDSRLGAPLKTTLISKEPMNLSEQVCILTNQFDPRWPLLAEFGFDHTISSDLETCGLMRLRPISDGVLTAENLPEFVNLVISFTNSPSHQGGFTAADIYPVLEELGLFEAYLNLLEPDN